MQIICESGMPQLPPAPEPEPEESEPEEPEGKYHFDQYYHECDNCSEEATQECRIGTLTTWLCADCAVRLC